MYWMQAEIVEAFLEGREAKEGDGRTDGYSIYLFNREIARWVHGQIRMRPVLPDVTGKPRSTTFGLPYTDTCELLQALCDLTDATLWIFRRKGCGFVENRKTGTVVQTEVDEWYYVTGPNAGRKVE